MNIFGYTSGQKIIKIKYAINTDIKISFINLFINNFSLQIFFINNESIVKKTNIGSKVMINEILQLKPSPSKSPKIITILFLFFLI